MVPYGEPPELPSLTYLLGPVSTGLAYPSVLKHRPEDEEHLKGVRLRQQIHLAKLRRKHQWYPGPDGLFRRREPGRA